MPDFRLATPTTLPSPNGFSHVAILDAGQRLVWTSGQVALTPDGELIGPADWEAQTRAVMRNLTVALDARRRDVAGRLQVDHPSTSWTSVPWRSFGQYTTSSSTSTARRPARSCRWPASSDPISSLRWRPSPPSAASPLRSSHGSLPDPHVGFAHAASRSRARRTWKAAASVAASRSLHLNSSSSSVLTR
jgi:enamine deaminase RidA (YjgF/YER057c/UK114 family)